jgi:CBS domain containing-hemolysin-like protein
MERPGRLLATHAFVAGAAYAASASLLTWAVSTTYDIPMYAAVLVAIGVAGMALFAFGEALPRTFALQSPERVALALVRPARVLTAMLYPFARVLSILWTWGMGLVVDRKWPGAPWVTYEEYGQLEAGNGDGDAEQARRAEEALIESVERYSDRIVREVMVPRTDMACLEGTSTAHEALGLIREAGFSRLPVFHENLDDIRGILYARDVLLAMEDGWDPEMRISRLARPAYFVPETKPVHELLVQMRRTAHLAMVADEYGGTAGLVTIEDLLEEIVGEIFDEYDRQVPLMVDLGGGRHRVDARMPVTELNEHFGTDIEREADSVGGLFIEEAGRIPETGESVTVEGLRLVVHELQGNRILQLLVQSTGETAGKGHHDGDHAV